MTVACSVCLHWHTAVKCAVETVQRQAHHVGWGRRHRRRVHGRSRGAVVRVTLHWRIVMTSSLAHANGRRNDCTHARIHLIRWCIHHVGPRPSCFVTCDWICCRVQSAPLTSTRARTHTKPHAHTATQPHAHTTRLAAAATMRVSAYVYACMHSMCTTTHSAWT